MSTLLMLHLLGLGIWIGVVGAEFAIEFYGMRDNESLHTAAELHYKTDLWIEIPAFMTVLVTGTLMLRDAQIDSVFLMKIVFALLAIFFNCICVYAVIKRRTSLRCNDAQGLATSDRAMRIGSAIIPTFLVALSLGLYLSVR